MDGYWMLPALIAGIYFATKLTRWINYFTYGQNMETKKKTDGKPDTNREQGSDDAKPNR